MMPKAQKRRKAPARVGTMQSHIANTNQTASSSQKSREAPAGSGNVAGTGTTNINRSFLSPSVSGPQSLVFPAMVALGSWGMAFTLIFLTNDPNRYLIGGMAVLIALFWSFSFSIRMRKLLLQQRGGS
jgi:hypothetical protein